MSLCSLKELNMLSIERSILIIIDAQGRLARVVAESEAAVERICILVKGAQLLDVPALLTAQAPEKIGHTIPEIASLLPEHADMPRISFSIWRDQAVRLAVQALDRKQLLLCGFEAHICLYQSAMDLLAEGFEVYLVADAVSSRRQSDKSTALAELSACGVHLTTVEIALFALMQNAQHPAFKSVSTFIK
jgi:nicotinamidase-related amidase